MLVLSRKSSEEILIDNCITVRVVKVDGQKVRIGIDAPDEIPVHRAEVARRIDDQWDSHPMRRAGSELAPNR